ncbi:MAG: TonB-dependent receptor plug domain-containing protein [Gemmatimonadaceae bacterium]
MGVGSGITPKRTAKTFALAIVLVGALVRANVAAQAPLVIAQNALRIYVVNDVDRPVAMAEVRMSLGQRSAVGRTDSTGLFRADNLQPGEWHASVRRIGYTATQVDLHVAHGENAFTVTVDPLAEVLSDVNIVDAKRISIRLADFEARRARSEPNAVITREQIMKRDPISLSQMLRSIPGVQVIDDFGVKQAIATRGAVPGQAMPGEGATLVVCPMRISVDGMMRPPGTSLDETVPRDVHGIEVYYGPARLPLQLATFRADKWCGLVAIWTRDK